VEIPSDYAGVLYQPLDDKGAWKLTLAKELKAAGLPVDMNKAL
jgi:predicted nucleotide-binding protein